jgi:hypothetical protein
MGRSHPVIGFEFPVEILKNFQKSEYIFKSAHQILILETIILIFVEKFENGCIILSR